MTDHVTNRDIKRHVDWGMIGVIFALVIQGAGTVWWASSMDRRVSQLEQDIAPVRAATETVARLDERTAAIKEGMNRIERRLDAQEAKR